MMGEASWTDCATQVMEEKEQVWFTVQAIVTEIKERNMKPSMCHMPANEACRSLRSCLRHHAKKENGKFVRKNSTNLIEYALRKGLQNKGTKTTSSSSSNKKKISKPVSQAPRLVGGALVVEIDSPDLSKTQRPRTPREVGQPGFLLPSPSSSLLGTRRTLSVLSSSSGDNGGRPVRKTRGRKPRDWDNVDKQIANDHTTVTVYSPTTITNCSTPQMESEEVGSVLTRDNWLVAFLKSPYNDSTVTNNITHHPLKPTHVQGDKNVAMMCEVDPDQCFTSEFSSYSSSCEDSESPDSCSEDDVHPLTLPTSTQNKTCLSGLSQSHSDRNSQLVVPTYRKPEAIRQLAALLSPSSPLVGENLKVLLGMVAFNDLHSHQKQQLIHLLPSVDQTCSNTLQPISLSNSFYGSACREWQDQLALGLHGNSSGRRNEKKNKTISSWKDSFFESEWGQSEECKESWSREEVFFPCGLGSPLSSCLSSIICGYQSRTPPSPPHSPPPPPPETCPITQSPPTVSRKKKIVPKVQERLVVVKATEKLSFSRTKKENKNNFKTPSLSKKHQPRNNVIFAHKNRVSRSMFLSSLPHKMSYTSLIDALHKASQRHIPTKVSPPTPSSVPETHHSHSVFHDHFSTLGPHSVPSAFLSSPLLVSLPRSLLNNVLTQRTVHSDHNYTPLTSDLLPISHSLTLSPPPPPPPPPTHWLSCSSSKLVLCSTCNSLYHPHCSHGNLCPTCSRPRTTPLS